MKVTDIPMTNTALRYQGKNRLRASLARAMSNTVDVIPNKTTSIYAWTDVYNALQWLRNRLGERVDYLTTNPPEAIGGGENGQPGGGGGEEF
jgi:hypothetical protein